MDITITNLKRDIKDFGTINGKRYVLGSRDDEKNPDPNCPKPRMKMDKAAWVALEKRAVVQGWLAEGEILVGAMGGS